MDTGRNVKQILFISSSYSNKQECWAAKKDIRPLHSIHCRRSKLQWKVTTASCAACMLYVVRLHISHYSESCKSHERSTNFLCPNTLQRQKSNNISIFIFHWWEHVALTQSVTILEGSSGNRVIGIQ